MDPIWDIETSFNTWTKVLRHVKFSNDPAVGYIETWADTDGNASTTWTAVPASGQACDTGCKWNADTVSAPSLIGGNVQRIYTNTMKYNTEGTYSGTLCDDANRCSHQRHGIYRGGNVNNINGDSTAFFDSTAAGPSLAEVLQAAF
jgi:hypothetical protein